jgi:hypothetical protein
MPSIISEYYEFAARKNNKSQSGGVGTISYQNLICPSLVSLSQITVDSAHTRLYEPKDQWATDRQAELHGHVANQEYCGKPK